MDRRHRVYYLVNLNQNHKLQGWWSRGWDGYGLRYRANTIALQIRVPSLKVSPNNQINKRSTYYQMKVSCKKEDEERLVNQLRTLKDVDYVKCD